MKKSLFELDVRSDQSRRYYPCARGLLITIFFAQIMKLNVYPWFLYSHPAPCRLGHN